VRGHAAGGAAILHNGVIGQLGQKKGWCGCAYNYPLCKDSFGKLSEVKTFL